LHDTECRGTFGGISEQGGLADTRLASDDQNVALTLARVGEKPVESSALAKPVQKPERKGGHCGNANQPASNEYGARSGGARQPRRSHDVRHDRSLPRAAAGRAGKRW